MLSNVAIAFGFLGFGVASLALSMASPVIWVAAGFKPARARRMHRAMTSRAFRGVVRYCESIGLLKVLYKFDRGDRESLRRHLASPGGSPGGGADAAPRSGSPRIVVANHISFFDVLIIIGLHPQCVTFVDRKFFYNPLLWPIVKSCGYIPVNKASSRSQLDAYFSARVAVAEGSDLVVFPEGTRSRTGQLGPFHSGAFKLALDHGCAIVPLALVSSQPLCNKRSFFKGRSGAVTVEVHALDHVETSGANSAFRRAGSATGVSAQPHARGRADARSALSDLSHQVRCVFERFLSEPGIFLWNRHAIGTLPFRGGTLRILRMNAESAHACFRVEPENPLFEGHFRGLAVFPAVGQLELVEALASRWLGHEIEICGLRRCKFTDMITPGTDLEITLGAQGTPEERRLRWEIKSADTLFSKGTAAYASLHAQER